MARRKHPEAICTIEFHENGQWWRQLPGRMTEDAAREVVRAFEECGKRARVVIFRADGHTHLVPCDGDAHENPFIDHCGLCAPRWGLVEVPIAFETLQAYRKSKQPSDT